MHDKKQYLSHYCSVQTFGGQDSVLRFEEISPERPLRSYMIFYLYYSFLRLSEQYMQRYTCKSYNFDNEYALQLYV